MGQTFAEVVMKQWPELSGRIELLTERENDWLVFMENPLQDCLHNREDLETFFNKIGIKDFEVMEHELVAIQNGRNRRKLTMKASEIKIEPTNWLIEDVLLERGVHIIGGDPEIGKSFITTYMGAKLSSGQSCFGVTNDPMKVMYICAEDDLSTTASRLKMNGANLDVCMLYKLDDLTFPSGMHKLQVDIAEEQPKVVFIDVINSFLDDGIDIYKDTSIRKALKPFKNLAEFENIAFVIVTHLKKGSEDKAIYRFNGSLGAVAFARVGFMMAREEDSDERVFSIVKSNLGKKHNYKFHWSWENPQVSFLGITEQKANDIGRQLSAVDECEEDIVMLLEESTTSSLSSNKLKKDIESMGHSLASYNRAIKELKKVNKVSHNKEGGQTYIVLKDVA